MIFRREPLTRQSRSERPSHRPSSRASRSLCLMLSALIVSTAPVSAQDPSVAPEGPTVSLSLTDALSMAMDSNLDIAVRRYDLGISDAGVDTARSAYDSTLTSNFTERDVSDQNANPFAATLQFDIKSRTFNSTWNDPTIWGGNFNVFFQGQKATFSQGISVLNPQYSSALNLTYDQSLLRNFGLDVNQGPIVIAQNDTKISRSQFRDTVMATLEATEAAYWELVFARRDLEVRRQSLKLARELLKINKAKVKVGTLAPIDVTQAEAGEASREEDVIVAEAAVQNAEDDLRQLLNPRADSPLWTSTIVPSDPPAFSVVEPNVDSAIETARENRPELEQQRLTITNNSLQEKIDRKAKRWDLNVQGRYDLEGLEGRDVATAGTVLDTDITDAFEGLNETEFADWTAQLTLTIPVGNRAARARYATSHLRHQQSQTEMDRLLLVAEIDVRKKVRDVLTNIKRVQAAGKNRELQEENVDAEEKKYDNGMSTSFTVLEVQEDLATAESQEHRALVDYKKSLAALERAKGTLLEARNIEVAPYGTSASLPPTWTSDLVATFRPGE